jgi:hypothetical protein
VAARRATRFAVPSLQAVLRASLPRRTNTRFNTYVAGSARRPIDGNPCTSARGGATSTRAVCHAPRDPQRTGP